MTQFLIRFHWESAPEIDYLLVVEAPNKKDAAREAVRQAPALRRVVTDVMELPTESGRAWGRTCELRKPITLADVMKYKRVWVDVDDHTDEIWVRDFFPEEDIEPTREWFHVFAVEEVDDLVFDIWRMIVDVDE